MPRTLYRIVNTDPPGRDDFRWYADLGQRPFRNDAFLMRVATGLSMFDTLDAARAKGMGKLWKSHGYVAELSLPDDDTVTIEKTAKDRNHFTVWADEELIRASVIRVVPIVEEQNNV